MKNRGNPQVSLLLFELHLAPSLLKVAPQCDTMWARILCLKMLEKPGFAFDSACFSFFLET